MLGRYREYNNGQAGAIQHLKENLEQSIGQLRSQRLLRNSGRSLSVTSLSASDLDAGAAAESHRFPPTSPLKDYGLQGNKRTKSRAAFHFGPETEDMAQIHAFHQSLRDLSSEQLPLGEDFNRELSRRSRSDAETKRALEELTQKFNEAQKQEVVSDRVEWRLKEIEREMRTERELVEIRQDQLGLMSLQLQEVLRKQEAKAEENEGIIKTKLRQTETEKSQVLSSGPDIHYDPHRWLAESKTKLQWLCEELKERENREKNLRHQLMLCRQQLRDLTENKESELQCLFQQIERQEQLLEEIHQEKRDLLEETQRKEEEVESLQGHVNALEMSTRVALDHLESVPEKLSLLEDFKDLRDSSERVDRRYCKYRVHRDSLKQCQDDTRYRIKNLKDDKAFTKGSSTRGLDHSSSWKDHSHFLSSPRFSHLSSLPAFTKRTIPPDPASIKEDAPSLPLNGASPQSKKDEYENQKTKCN